MIKKIRYLNLIESIITVSVLFLAIQEVLFPFQSRITYLLFAMAGTTLFVSIPKQKWNNTDWSLFLLFFGLLLLQILGIIKNPIFHALRNVGGTLCVMLFFLITIQRTEKIEVHLLPLFFLFCIPIYIIILFMLYREQVAVYQNTLSGGLCFFYCMNLFFYFSSNESKKKRILIPFILLALFSLWITKGRTGVFTFVFILVFYIFLNRVAKNNKIYGKLLLAFVIGLIIGLIFYSNITSFSWYEDVNQYSVEYFGKNLDSSRGEIWITELSRLNGNSYVFGLGTGILPELERYSTASFHSTYVQMLIQNGISSLVVLYMIFYFITKRLEQFRSDKAIRFCFAVLLGVILYNCFETTLLQNKISVGIIEWFILGLGIKRTRYLEDIKGKSL